MKVIKKGKPYRIHKCSRCNTKYAYKEECDCTKLVRCPECGNYLDFHFYDRKISQEKYDKLGE